VNKENIFGITQHHSYSSSVVSFAGIRGKIKCTIIYKQNNYVSTTIAFSRCVQEMLAL